eukprot:6119742-Prymnesium_polylepis.1
MARERDVVLDSHTCRDNCRAHGGNVNPHKRSKSLADLKNTCFIIIFNASLRDHIDRQHRKLCCRRSLCRRRRRASAWAVGAVGARSTGCVIGARPTVVAVAVRG